MSLNDKQKLRLQCIHYKTLFFILSMGGGAICTCPTTTRFVFDRTKTKRVNMAENADGDAAKRLPDAEETPDKSDASDATAQDKASSSKVGDVVVLDDDENPDYDVIDLVRNEMTGNTKCINYACKSGSEMFEPPSFCLSYYRVRNKVNKKQQICMECYEKALELYDSLTVALANNEPLLNVEVPFRNDIFEIDDSDSDEEANKDDRIGRETMEMLAEYFDDTLLQVLDKYNFKNQVDQSLDILKKNLDTVNDSFLEVQAMFKSIRNESDAMIFELSDVLRPDNVELTPLDLNDKKLQTVSKYPPMRGGRTPSVGRTGSQPPLDPKKTTGPIVLDLDNDDRNKSSKEVGVTSAEKGTEVSYDLPPKGPLVKPPLRIGETYYANRSELGAWVKVRLAEIITPGTRRDGQIFSKMMFVVTIVNKQKNIISKVISGKKLAYSTPSQVQLDVGARVIAVFRETVNAREPKKNRKDLFYPGIVAEPLQEANNNRYLIFFDDGYAQYVSHKFVYLTYEASKDVWDDVNINSRAFIKKYLENYPARPMVKLLKDQTVRTEYNGKWWVTTVMSVDCSLVQMFFDASSRVEWIYRGSTRLNPMFKEEQAATSRLQHRQRATRKINSSSAPYVQYTRSDGDAQPPEQQQGQQQQQQRSVARKSTSRPQQINNSITSNINSFLPTNDLNREAPATKIVSCAFLMQQLPRDEKEYYTPRRQKPKTNIFTPHVCCPKCKEYMYCSLSRLKGYSPLSKPLLCGFYRLMLKVRNRKLVAYKAPCGRTLRNMYEVHLYLRMSKLDLTVDLFDFNAFVRCLAEFMVDQKNVLVKDLSMGLEECPITVANYVDTITLDFCNYSIRREPMEGVDLNLDRDFLCGCDCIDDCIDRSKCSCWQLTLQCLKFMDKDTDPESIGYQYRRLPEAIFTGIYECNSKCKCASTCLNRVVQNPMQHKLQVFKTDSKGWGIRCLNDIPQGSFVCIYAGSLLTEQTANEGGQSYGDEYLAELDFIETVERMKEDYEEEAYEDDSVKEKTPEESAEEEDASDDDEDHGSNDYLDDTDFVPSTVLRSDSDQSEIRSRLRRRNSDKKQEDTKKPAEKAKPKVTYDEDDTVTISDDEDYEPREALSFNPKSNFDEGQEQKYLSVREMFGKEESVYIMDAKSTGNIGRFLNHSCTPNIFVQNVFVDTQDVRFPWVSFFAMSFIRAGTELTWNYNYDVGSVPGKVLYCYCGSSDCKGRLL